MQFSYGFPRVISHPYIVALNFQGGIIMTKKELYDNQNRYQLNEREIKLMLLHYLVLSKDNKSDIKVLLSFMMEHPYIMNTTLCFVKRLTRSCILNDDLIRMGWHEIRRHHLAGGVSAGEIIRMCQQELDNTQDLYHLVRVIRACILEA